VIIYLTQIVNRTLANSSTISDDELQQIISFASSNHLHNAMMAGESVKASMDVLSKALRFLLNLRVRYR
jgi:hypothetical protein